MKITEAVREGTPLEHIEHLVLFGEQGLLELNNYIEQYDTDKVDYSRKIDGAPAVIMWSKFAGHEDNSIGLKSSLKGSSDLDMSSIDEIEERFGDRPGTVKMLAYCLRLAKYIPEGQAWQGDCLFTSDSKQKRIINGEEYLTFQRNKIIYAFSPNSVDYNKVNDAEFGIAFHTIYKIAGDSISQQFKLDRSIINAPWVYIMPQDASVGKIDIKPLYNELLNLESKLMSDPEYEELCSNQAFQKYWSTFENSSTSDRRTNKINISSFYNELVEYIDTKMNLEYQKRADKLTTDKGKERAKQEYLSSLDELQTIIARCKNTLINTVRTFNCVVDIKTKLLTSLDSEQLRYETFLLKRTGEYEPVNGEEIALSDASGNVVKLIDGAKFSAANRSNDYVTGFDSDITESTAPWVKNTINTVSNTDRDPAVRATKAWDRMKVKTLKKGQMIAESAGKTVYFTLGKFAPFTNGHAAMVDKMVKMANGNEVRLYTTHRLDAEHPMSYDRKIYWIEKAVGDKVNVVRSEANNLFDVMYELYDEGYNNVCIIGGDDRIEELAARVRAYNGKPTKGKYYKFDYIGPTPEEAASIRADSDRITSSTEVRQVVREGDFNKFKSLVPFKGADAVMLYDELRDGLGVTLTEGGLGLDDVTKYDNKYYDDVINDLAGDGVQLLSGDVVTLDDDDKIDKLRSLDFEKYDSDEYNPDDKTIKTRKRDDFQAITGIRWSQIFKGTYSGYANGGRGKAAENRTLDNDVKHEVLSQLCMYYKSRKYPNLNEANCKVVSATAQGNTNSKIAKLAGLGSPELYRRIFTVPNMFEGEEDVWGPATADTVYELELDVGGKIVNETAYLSIKDTRSTSNINLGLVTLSLQEAIDPILESSDLSDSEITALDSLWNITNTSLGYDSCPEIDGNIIHEWYHEFNPRAIKTTNLINYMINSYRCGYFYCHRIEGEWSVRPVSDVIADLRSKAKVTDARIYMIQSSIYIVFNFGNTPVKINMRQRGSARMTLEVRPEITYGRPKGVRLDDLDVVDRYVKQARRDKYKGS